MCKRRGPFSPLSAKQSFVRTWKVSDFHENDPISGRRTNPDLSIRDFFHLITNPALFRAAARGSIPCLSDLHLVRCLFAYPLVSFPTLHANRPQSPFRTNETPPYSLNATPIPRIVNAVHNSYLSPQLFNLTHFMCSRSSILMYLDVFLPPFRPPCFLLPPPSFSHHKMNGVPHHLLILCYFKVCYPPRWRTRVFSCVWKSRGFVIYN